MRQKQASEIMSGRSWLSWYDGAFHISAEVALFLRVVLLFFCLGWTTRVFICGRVQDRPLDGEADLAFVIRDMNYFVSHAGIIDTLTIQKLSRQDNDKSS